MVPTDAGSLLNIHAEIKDMSVELFMQEDAKRCTRNTLFRANLRCPDKSLSGEKVKGAGPTSSNTFVDYSALHLFGFANNFEKFIQVASQTIAYARLQTLLFSHQDIEFVTSLLEPGY